MSIFRKDCPQCARANNADAERCACGYRFEPENTTDAELALEQELLYRDYLAARISQAEAELNVARTQAAAEPENKTKAADALLAEQALNALRAEMQQHVLRYPALPKRVASPPPLPIAPAIKRAALSKKPLSTPPSKRPTVAAAQKPAVSVPPPPRKTHVLHKMAVRQPAATPKPAIPKPIPTPAAKPAVPAAVKPAPSPTPSATFRDLQARKAAALQSRAAPPRPMKPARPATARPADIPPLKPAAAAPPTQECPNCTASVPIKQERCSCGYLMSRPAQDIPAISLDSTSLDLITKGLGPKNR